jgi:hypothetical protein
MALTFTGSVFRADLPLVNLSDGRPTLGTGQFFAAVGSLLRQLAAAQVGPLTAVATPNNANALQAGVPIGGLYTSTADPAPVYIRTQ